MHMEDRIHFQEKLATVKNSSTYKSLEAILPKQFS